MVDFNKLLIKTRLEEKGYSKDDIKKWFACPKHKYRNAYISTNITEADEIEGVDIQKGLVCELCGLHKKVWDDVKNGN